MIAQLNLCGSGELKMEIESVKTNGEQRFLPRWGILIFSYIRRLGPFWVAQKFEFQNF